MTQLPGAVICANCMDITEGALGQRIAIVAHAAAGLLHYAEQPEQAYADFMAALDCAGEVVDPDLLAMLAAGVHRKPEHPAESESGPLHYYAGKVAVLTGDYPTGIELSCRPPPPKTSMTRRRRLEFGAAYQEWTGDKKAPEAVAVF